MLLFWLLGPYAADAAINLCNCVYLCLLWPYTTSPARGATGLLHLPVLHIPTNQFFSRMTSLPSVSLAMLPSSSMIPVVQAMIPLDLCRGLVLLTWLIISQFFYDLCHAKQVTHDLLI